MCSCIHTHTLFYLYKRVVQFLRLLSRIETSTTTVNTINSTSTSGCVKCVAIAKSDKLSCCARGASWFNKCGDVGDVHFDHTWAEGIHACKDFGDLVSVQSPLRVMSRRAGRVSHPRNSSQVRTMLYGPVSISKTHSTGRAGCATIERVAIVFRFLFIILHCQI